VLWILASDDVRGRDRKSLCVQQGRDLLPASKVVRGHVIKLIEAERSGLAEVELDFCL